MADRDVRIFTASQWVELRMPVSQRLVAKFDPRRALLQVRVRGEEHTFDLQAIAEKQKHEVNS